MEKIAWQAYLYDFYGVLLTEHQRAVYEDAVSNDMSLSEIADEYGITRQGVHDLIRRCNSALEGYEEKLHLVERFFEIKQLAGKVKDLASNECTSDPQHEGVMKEIAYLADQIIDGL